MTYSEKLPLRLSDIAIENSRVLVDTCVLSTISNLNECFDKDSSILDVFKILNLAYDYSTDLFDFINNNSNVCVTSEVYQEYLKGLPKIRKFGEVAFIPGTDTSFRKKIAKTQSYYLKLSKLLKDRVIYTNEQKKFFDFYQDFFKYEMKEHNFPYISKTDIRLFTCACFFNLRQEKTAIVTRDYDLMRLEDFCTGNGCDNCLKPVGWSKSKIYMPIEFNSVFSLGYRQIN